MIKLRKTEESDESFLESVYRSTREDELNITGWTETQKNAFIHMQSMAQHTDYKCRFPGMNCQVIIYKKKDAGRLYTWEGDMEIRLIDIALLPQFRGKGIGSFLLKELIKRSNAVQKKISLHVETSNPALQLYLRMGFVHISNFGRHYYMERNPEAK